MTAEFKPYMPILPQEAVLFLGEEARQWEWYPYPSRSFWSADKNGRQIEYLDNSEAVIAIAKQKGLYGCLEAVDLTVGCRFPCQTCVRDSQALSSVMSLEAAKRIIRNPVFNDLIPEWSFCVGFTAEPSDNPNVLEIIDLMLAASHNTKDGYRVGIKTNYRKQKEEIVCQLMNMAGNNDKATLTISLPLNRDNHIQDDFEEFKRKHADLFNNNIHVFDLKNPTWQEVENLGRVLLGAKEPGIAEVEMFQVRGKAGLLLNPEGLWLMVNTTRYEAHTPEIFTPVTAANIDLVAREIKWMNQRTSLDYSKAKFLKKAAEEEGRNGFISRKG